MPIDPEPESRYGTTPDNASALPSPLWRFIGFASVLFGGLGGALIGVGIANFECSGSCDTWKGLAMLLGSLFGAVGVAVIVDLTLRAMQEWRPKVE